MLCSTIIPTVHRPSLERAVKSALSQNLVEHQHEIIVVNDSGEPLPEYDWLRYENVKILNTNRIERSAARNAGAVIASGKYLHFLDDDDYLLPGGLQALLDVAVTSDCCWIYGALNRMDEEGSFMSLNRPENRGNVFALVAAGETFPLPASMIRREEFFNVGGFDPKFAVMEDRDLQCRIAFIGDFDRTDCVIANARIGTGGRSTTDWRRVGKVNRSLREKTLGIPGVVPRMQDSIGNDVVLRGRCCRSFLISMILNIQNGYFLVASKRIFDFMRVMGVFFFLPTFWKGMFIKSHWHSVEKQREEDHYRAMQAKKVS